MRHFTFLKILFLIISTVEVFSSFQCRHLTTTDNVKIRIGHFCGKNANPSSNKAILILPGMVSCIERQEFIAEKLAEKGFDVWTLDFRGQGQSQRMVDNKEMVHVDDFNQYITDVETLLKIQDLQGKKISIYSHSMGGQVTLQILKKYPTKFEYAILEAPMIQIKTAPVPFILAEPLAYVFKNWLGKNKNFCIGHGYYNLKKQSFEHNSSCRDTDLFYKYHHVNESQKELIPVGPSWGWVYSVLHTTKTFLNDLSPLKKVTTKILLVTAEDDRRVNTKNDYKVAAAFLNAAHRIYKNARHCILHDTLETREEYLSDITSFLKDADLFLKEYPPSVNKR